MNGAAMYSSVQAVGAVDAQIMQHAPLVKRIAYHLLSKLPDSVLVDDLIQAGMLGLLEALKNYDHSQGASFETYAGIRIRGSMLDEVRRSDWTPRSVHKKSRQVTEAIKEIESKTTQNATAGEIAGRLGISLGEYNKILQDSNNSRFFSVEELAQTGDHFIEGYVQDSAGPEDIFGQDKFKEALATAIGQLPEREKLVISLYYDEELNLREIGEVLSVSESRVSQISSQAMHRLRSKLADWLEGNDNNESS
ncbi:RNA polymerase sigma factor FliA [methanotrophic endosymbiont of Bathymodiolus puteoserpentis (Logatchev)]|uniref:RNA polymerase sigma factor FliA n=1 Tax=methanotrophic endosymbiont of Bathymodiolus puteoserpentis (Logatchev) TaxID=343235 RepID=UPI0013C7FB88|nr:RNA polymerase sigma factor FliA [methanotrophic endosymbiont of Bathymodiolus puteoserpentis (Logatchev)]SHE23164.1 RNA polymerase sigma factor for flagellar operon [methanotrophic endosymbiont of Bathymodiolus puteoserpentis (Logatchev)]